VVGGQHHAPAALPPRKTRYPLYRRLGGPQGSSERVRKISPPPGFDPRTVQPVISRYVATAVVRLISEDDKGRLKLENACYPSVQNILSSSLLSKNLNFNIYRTIIFTRPALGPTQPSVQWVPGLSRGKAAGAWCLPPTPFWR
jgi:hypothetical protein